MNDAHLTALNAMVRSRGVDVPYERIADPKWLADKVYESYKNVPIQAIKDYRNLTACSLLEAKDKVKNDIFDVRREPVNNTWQDDALQQLKLVEHDIKAGYSDKIVKDRIRTLLSIVGKREAERSSA